MRFLRSLWCRPVLAIAASLGFACAPATGQDVSVSPLQWTDPNDAPDEMPALQRNPQLKFPEALRPTPDIGYVVIDFILDAKARKLGSSRATTTPAFIRVYEEAFEQFKFTPARRDGKPVNAAVTLALIFNPASADPEKPDATPRLLEVDVVSLPRPKDAKPTDNFDDIVVIADIAIDATGRVTAVKNVPPGLEKPFENSLKNWRFAPARQDGQPIAAEIRAPFVLETEGGEPTPIGKRTLPRVTFQARPQYPWIMRASGMRGDVIVDFVVDIEGRVRNAFVHRSLNPAFDDPALEAVKKWRFEPGRIGAVPTNTHMQVPIRFELNDTPNGGDDGVEIRHKANMAMLPEELRYDTPPRLVATARPVYPLTALNEGRKGKATVRYIVDESGRIALASVVEASAPEFGQALLAAIEQFVYEPAVKAGRPNKALMSFSQEFTTDEAHQLIASDDLRILRLEQKKPERIRKGSELDGALKLVSQKPAKFPIARVAQGKPGEAMVEFLVDEEGRARLPRIVSATDDAFGYAAVQSVASWRFEPPKHGGKSAIVRVRAPIAFRLSDGPVDGETK